MPEAVAQICTALDRNPRLRRLFDAVYAQVRTPRTAVAVGGSASRNEVDEFSDLDIVVLTPDESTSRRLRDDVHSFLRSHYDVLTTFDASYLGLSCLESIFLVVEERVTKIDMVFAASDRPAPVGGVLIYDALGASKLFDEVVPPGASEIFRAPVDIIGWTCQARNLICRGELFEAAYCLDAMRRRMLVPVLLSLSGAAQVNYRRIEERLPPARLARLRETVPKELARHELWRALISLVSTFLDSYTKLPAREQKRAPDTVGAALGRILAERCPSRSDHSFVPHQDIHRTSDDVALN